MKQKSLDAMYKLAMKQEMAKNYKYVATIAGGIGDKTWDKDITVFAKNFRAAVEILYSEVNGIDADIVAMEQID